jgi:hypothetical protein
VEKAEEGKLNIENPTQLIAQILWHHRFEHPSLSVTVKDRDIAALNQCLEFNKQTATVTIQQRDGFAIIVLTDEKGNAITPVENNQEDYDKARAAKTMARMREEGPGLARAVANRAMAGEFSASEVNDLCQMVITLAGAR